MPEVKLGDQLWGAGLFGKPGPESGGVMRLFENSGPWA